MAKKETYTHSFIWKQDGNVAIFGVKIKKSIDDDKILSGQLICPKCKGDLSQRYICSCGFSGTIGEIKERKDKETGIIYTTEEKKQFLKTKVENTINVIGYMPISELARYSEILTGNSLEIYSKQNEKYIVGLYQYLLSKGIMLIAKVGYYENTITALIIPTINKLIIKPVYDMRLVRSPNQEGIPTIVSEFDMKMAEYTKDNKIDLEEEFIKKKLNGEAIVVEEKKEEIKEVSEQPFFMQEIEKKEKKKEVLAVIS